MCKLATWEVQHLCYCVHLYSNARQVCLSSTSALICLASVLQDSQELCAGHPVFASFLEYAKSLRFEAPTVASIGQAVDMIDSKSWNLQILR